jgi:S-adenosylhomocysteine hydrolase
MRVKPRSVGPPPKADAVERPKEQAPAKPPESAFGGAPSPAPEAQLKPDADVSQARLQALIHPLADANPTAAPPAKQLAAMIKDALGSAADQLSPLEQAAALGHASWAQADEGVRAPNFLLAAKLARFMDNVFPGASLDEVATAFSKTTPGVQAAFPKLDGKTLAALQKAYPFLPQWSVSPKASPAAKADDWMSMPDTQNAFAERLSKGLEQLSQISFDMPLTRGLGERLSKDQPLAKTNVVMVQHALGQAYGELQAMTQAGLDPKKSEYVFIPYQQASGVKLSLETTFGLPVMAPKTGDIDEMYQCVGAAIDKAFANHQQNKEPILVFDDGGYASKWIASHYPDDAAAFHVVEQTTRGLTEVSTLKPKFPVVAVASSYTKRLESDQVGDAIFSSVMKVMEALTQTPNHKDVLIVGGGKIGESTALAAKNHGVKSVSIYDPFLIPSRKKQLEDEGFHVITDKVEALKDKFLIIGTSGQRSIDMQDILNAASGDPERPVFVASGSSKHVEIDHPGLAQLATDDQGRLRKFLVATVGEQETYSYWLRDGRIVTALADDLPVNFQGVNSVAPEEIDKIMALMITGGLQALRSKAQGLVDVDQAPQFDIEARGAQLTVGAGKGKDQLTIEVGGQAYSGTRDQWRELAGSKATPPDAQMAIFKAFSADKELSAAAPLTLDGHDLPPDAVEQVLSVVSDQGPFGYLKPLSTLMQNEALPPDQQDRAIAFLLKDERERRARGAQQLHDRNPKLITPKQLDIALHSQSPWELDKAKQLGGREVQWLRDEIVLSNPRAPNEIFRDLVDDPKLLQRPMPENVFALSNPRWTSAQLETFLDVARHVRGVGPASQRYEYDLMEALANHPNASKKVRDYAKDALDYLNGTGQYADELADAGPREHVQKGRAGWKAGILGVPLPDYEGALDELSKATPGFKMSAYYPYDPSYRDLDE